MNRIASTLLAGTVAGITLVSSSTANAWWNDDYYDRHWGGGPWYGGYPGYGWGGYPGYGWGGYPGHGWGGYPGHGWGGYPGYGWGNAPSIIYLNPPAGGNSNKGTSRVPR